MPDMEIVIDNDGNVDVITNANNEDIDIVLAMLAEMEKNQIEINRDEDMEIDQEETDDEEDMDIEQEGGNASALFTIENVFQRNIPKFNVQGYEYRLTITEMTHMEYLEAVQMLHLALNRKYIYSICFQYRTLTYLKLFTSPLF